MILKRFRAEQYRNIERCEIEFAPGVNLVWGNNAQGKTNALEGIYYFARGKSFRAATDGELVKFGARGLETEITYQSEGREQTLLYRYENGLRERLRNGVRLSRLTEMLGHFRAVLFYPEHLQIVKAGPEKRREFLNIAISQTDPGYLTYYAQYCKILENRNYLLKTAQKGGSIDMTELSAWSEKMAACAAEIYIRRRRYLEGFSPLANQILRDLSSDAESLTIRYEADTDASDLSEARRAYERALGEHTVRECAAGCSLIGVHRDDLDIQLGGISARSFASQGQQRSIVLAMKLAEGEYSKKLTGEYPVFLFDDVLSELDERRRSYVLGDTGEKQLILTACDRYAEMKGFHEVNVEGGNYVCTHR